VPSRSATLRLRNPMNALQDRHFRASTGRCRQPPHEISRLGCASSGRNVRCVGRPVRRWPGHTVGAGNGGKSDSRRRTRSGRREWLYVHASQIAYWTSCPQGEFSLGSPGSRAVCQGAYE
jgi:hypothetical protein